VIGQVDKSAEYWRNFIMKQLVAKFADILLEEEKCPEFDMRKHLLKKNMMASVVKRFADITGMAIAKEANRELKVNAENYMFVQSDIVSLGAKVARIDLMTYCDSMILYCEALEHKDKAVRQRMFHLACEKLQAGLSCNRPAIWVNLAKGLLQLDKASSDPPTRNKNLDQAEWVLSTLFDLARNSVAGRMLKYQVLGHLLYAKVHLRKAELKSSTEEKLDHVNVAVEQCNIAAKMSDEGTVNQCIALQAKLALKKSVLQPENREELLKHFEKQLSDVLQSSPQDAKCLRSLNKIKQALQH
jgi:hypothetical protein